MDQCVRTRRRQPPQLQQLQQLQQQPDAAAVQDAAQLSGILERDQRTVRVALRTLRPCQRVRRDARSSRRRSCGSCSCSGGCSVGCQCRAPPLLVCDQCSDVLVRRTPPLCQCRIPRDTKYSSSYSSSPSTSRSTTSSRSPSGSTIRWLVAALCVLALLPPPAMAAPAPAPPAAAVPAQQPKWINPCGFHKRDVEQEMEHEYLNAAPVPVSDLMQQIVVPAKNALMHAEQFRDDYVRRTFDVSFEKNHNNWLPYKYDWLPTIEKRLGKKADEEDLEKQNLDEALKDIYQYLQQYAVGLEQIVWDMEKHGGDFRKEFEDVEYKLRAVLCEVQVAMAERGVSQHPDVARDIMDQEIRNMKHSTHRRVRDWIIFRDYMNGLEYMIQLFEHFNNRPQVRS